LPVVAAFTIDGLRMWFWSNDHIPMHFHVERPGEWEIAVDIMGSVTELSYTVKWGSGPNGSLRAQLLAQVNTHRVALVLEWSAKVNP
jgi:hypothetical protein